MARRKGVSKTKNSHARKLTSGSNHPPRQQQDDRLKDDPGGTSPHDMDKSGKIVAATATGEITTTSSNEKTTTVIAAESTKLLSKKVQNYKLLNNNHSKNSNVEESKNQNVINNVNKTKNSSNPDIVSHRQQQQHHHQQQQEELNSSEKDTREEYKSSNTTELINNTKNNSNNNNNNKNSNNISNNNNNNNNNSSLITSSSLATSSTSSSDLKYLHKKFKRIASATLDENINNIQQPQIKPIQRTEQENVVENNSKTNFFNEFSINNFPATTLNLAGVESEKQDTGKSRNNSLSSISSSSLSSTSSLSSSFYTNKLDENINSLITTTTTTPKIQKTEEHLTPSKKNSKSDNYQHKNKINSIIKKDEDNSKQFINYNGNSSQLPLKESSSSSNSSCFISSEIAGNIQQLKINQNYNLKTNCDNNIPIIRNEFSSSPRTHISPREEEEEILRRKLQILREQDEHRKYSSMKFNTNNGSSNDRRFSLSANQQLNSINQCSSSPPILSSVVPSTGGVQLFREDNSNANNLIYMKSETNSSFNNYVLENNSNITSPNNVIIKKEITVTTTPSLIINETSNSSNSHNYNSNSNTNNNNASVSNNQLINRVVELESSASNLRTVSPTKSSVITAVQNQQQKLIHQNSQLISQSKSPQQSTQILHQTAQHQREVDQNFSGRHVCPYCNLNCTKPSVLQKHIRAHTNERPYPCDTCGFAFKTKSNYYKHCRSRSHALRIKGGEPQPDEDGSLGSDQDQDPDLSNSSSDVISRTASPMDERMSSPAVQQQHAVQSVQKYSCEKPYKPKFHNASLYAKEENQQQSQLKHSNSNNQYNPTISNIYSPSSQLHHYQHPSQQQHQIQSTQINESDTQHHPFYQQQQQQQQQQVSNTKSRIELTPAIPPGAFQNVASSHSMSQSQTNPSSVTSHFLHHQISQQQSNHFHQSTISSSSPLIPRESTSSSSSPMFGGISTGGPHPLNRQFLRERISKIILENEAIVENKELLLQKKYPKISNKIKPVSSSMEGAGSSSSKLAYALANKQQQQQKHQQQQQHHHQLQQQIQQQPTPTQQHHSLPLTQSQYQAISTHREEIASSSKNVSYNNSHSTNVSNLVANQRITHVISANSNTSTDVSSQPLNLSKSNQEGIVAVRKRPSNDNPSQDITSTSGMCVTTSTPQPAKTHPQNPERSIIKHLLLNARGLGVPNGEGDDAVYICPLCNMEFHSAEDLRLHTSNYCQGGPSSAPISPVASPSHKYFRSNSINVNLPEFNNPNSLAKLARSSLLQLSRNPLSLAKLAWSQLKTKPSNLVLNQLNVNTNTTAGSSTQSSSSTSTSSNQVQQQNNNNTGDNIYSANNPSVQKLIDAPLPSPGPLLGKTPLVEAYNNTEKKSEDVIITKVHEEVRHFSKEQSPKRLRLNNYSQQSRMYEEVRSNANENEPNSFVQSTTSAGNYNLPPSMTAMHLEGPVSKTLLQPQQGYTMCGGEVQLLDKKEDRMKRFLSSGGCVIPISECPDIETSPKMIRTPLLSGGSFTEMSPKHGQTGNRENLQLTPSSTPKMMIPIAPLTPSLPGPNLLSAGLPMAVQHFQFPPINSITAFNPLTLPPVSVVPSKVMHGDKLIPFVPGMPGPNTLAPSPVSVLTIHSSQRSSISSKEATTSRNRSPNRKKTPSPLVQGQIGVPSNNSDNAGTQRFLQNQSPMQQIQSKSSTRVENETTSSQGAEFTGVSQRSPRSWTQSSTVETAKKSFNFTRIADNLSPRRPNNAEKVEKSDKAEVRHFNFDNIPKLDVIAPSPPSQQQQTLTPLHVDVTSNNKSKEPTENEITEARNKAKSKFLRPTSLPLKPGTFTPKRHHGITPTANTLPLISPETPRPSKACIQLYLNGHAYTYLGLKCSTKMFYCTVNCPQPSYVANLHKLSMYSVWQVCTENNLHPLGLKPKTVMSLYDSRQRVSSFSTAKIEHECTVSHSQSTVMTPFENNSGQFYHHQLKCIPAPSNSSSLPEDCMKSTNSSEQGNVSKSSILVGGYESNEDYTYIRGRGRGKYVCSECGIRCKKPSMLKKHIRTHTDVRPYTCQHCAFSFKTKGNLTKHMQSKTHYKKCLELGINPGPPPIDGDFMETDAENDQHSTTSGSGIGGGRLSSAPGESDSDDFSDGGDGETESSDTDESKSRLPEHEAARCLLSLSMTPPNNSSSSSFQTKSQLYSGGGYQQQSLKGQQHFEFGQASVTKSESVTQFGLSSNQISSAAAARRVISFTSPKPPFDYQKQEQYYSNPSIMPKGKDEKFDEVPMKPIDLTKPRQAETLRSFDVIGDISTETALLKSLVSNTDKVRTSSAYIHNQKVDENVLLQAYLTEQALQYRKIKQSQMNKNFSESSNTLNSTPTTANTMSVVSSPSLSASFSLVTTNAKLGIEKHLSNEPSLSLLRSSMAVEKEYPIYTKEENTNKQSKTFPMEVDPNLEDKSSSGSHLLAAGKTIHSESNSTLKDNKFNDPNELIIDAEPKSNLSTSIASKNEPEILAINQEAMSSPQRPKTSSSPLISNSGNNQQTGTGTGSAKSVASEYLKMTSAEYLKSRSNSGTTNNNQGSNTSNNNSKAEESEESSSDQEMPIQDNSSGANSLKPPADFGGILARTVIVGEDGFKSNPTEVQPMFPRVPISEDGRPICTICSKTFQKQHQLVLHMNIHYMERKFKCEPCAVSFRTQGHLQKHERSEAHKNKVMMTSTFGVPTTSNPRPFECSDCKVAFRIHGHLAKHLRSKTHVQKLECLQKLPFGTYAEIERAGISLTEIDTTDCDNSLASLKVLAQKLIEKDPSKLSSYSTPCLDNSRISSDSSINHSTGKRSEEFETSTISSEHPMNGLISHRDSKKDRDSGNSLNAGINVTLSPFPSGDGNSKQETSNGNNNPAGTNTTSVDETFNQAYRLQSITEGSGMKRKYDSFSSSSCSNDSLQNSINSVQQELTSSINNNEAAENGGSIEKKPRVSLSNDS